LTAGKAAAKRSKAARKQGSSKKGGIRGGEGKGSDAAPLPPPPPASRNDVKEKENTLELQESVKALISLQRASIERMEKLEGGLNAQAKETQLHAQTLQDMKTKVDDCSSKIEAAAQNAKAVMGMLGSLFQPSYQTYGVTAPALQPVFPSSSNHWHFLHHSHFLVVFR